MRLVWSLIFGLILAAGIATGWWIWADSQKTRTLTVAAGERGGDSHTLMSEISEVLERHSSTLRLRVLTSRNSSDGISRIRDGKVDLATIESNTPAYTSINLVAELFSDYFLLITRAPESQLAESNPNSGGALSPLEKITQLPGRRIAIPEAGSTGNLSFWSVIDHYKVPPESIRTFALPRDKAADAFMSGRADAIFFLLSLRDPFLLRFIENAGLRNMRLRFIPIEQADAMRLKRPYLQAEKIMTGSFDGALALPEEDVVVPSLHRLLVAGVQVDPDLINQLVETIFSNRLDLLIRMPLSSGIRDPRQGGTAGLGLHEGAQRFFDRDQPSFLQENAEPMALLVTMFAMGISALLALRRSLKARAKNKADVYNDVLLDIAARARGSQDLESLLAMRVELGEVLEKVVHALDIDQVTEQGFHSFSLLWSSVRETVNERIGDLR